MQPFDWAHASESDLIRQARGGSQEAFTGLVWQHQGAVRAFLGRYTRQRDVVDDLAQEVFVVAYRGLGTFKGESSLRLWLLGIARNQWLVYLRGEQRRRRREATRFEAELARWQVGRFEAASPSHADGELVALQECLERLPEQSERVVQEYYFRGRSAVSIAEELGRKPSAVRMTLLRVRESLRACIEQRLAAEGA